MDESIDDMKPANMYHLAFEPGNDTMHNYPLIKEQEFLLDYIVDYSTERIIDPSNCDVVLNTISYNACDQPGLVTARAYKRPVPIINFDRELQLDVAIPEYSDCVVKLQSALDVLVQTRSGICYFDKRYDQRIWNDTKVDVTSPGLIISESLRADSQRDYFQPMLQTPQQIPFSETQNSVLYAIQARNGASFDISNVVETEVLVKRIINGFIESYRIDPNVFKLFRESELTCNVTDMFMWLSGQPPDRYQFIRGNPYFKYFSDLTNDYMVELKRCAKHEVGPLACEVKNPPQVIVHQEKSNNAIECSIAKAMKSRFMSSLGDNVFVYTDCSPEQYAEILTHKLPYDICSNYVAVELDLAKFDKSQRRLALMLELMVMHLYGYNDDYIRAWNLKHTTSRIKNFHTLVMLLIWFQRRSGDGMTYIGNTIHNMMVLSEAFGPNVLKQSYVLVSGDDSVVYVPKHLYCDTMRNTVSRVAGCIFGLEAKVIVNKSFTYFCSRFILFLKDIIWFVPDVFKTAIRLGRNDIVSEEHMKEVYISLGDNLKVFQCYALVELVAEAIKERYELTEDPLMMCLYTLSISRDWEEYKELYYKHENDEYKTVSVLPSKKHM